MIDETNTEIVRLKTELGRAYRAIYGMRNAYKRGERPNDTMMGYHSPSLGAAARFVREGSLEGSEYFIGKPVDVLRAALSDPE